MLVDQTTFTYHTYHYMGIIINSVGIVGITQILINVQRCIGAGSLSHSKMWSHSKTVDDKSEWDLHF